MPALLELQRQFARAVLGGELASDAAELDIAGEPAGLALYRNNCLSNLTRALALNFPAVQRLVGNEFFEGAARQFIAQDPPASASLDDYGCEFAAFLADFAPAAGLSYLADVARLEWAVSRALHAPAAAGLEVGRLVALDAASTAELRFVPQPAISLLRLQTPADAIWRAVLDRDEAAMSALDVTGGPTYVLIERSQHGVEVRRLDAALWRLTQRLCAGEPLHQVLTAAQADLLGTDQINAMLADHLAHERFIDIMPPTAERAS
jgi:hypothetical protein